MRNWPTPHSTIWSALASNVGGISTPSALAVFRLIANSNFVGCSIGMSRSAWHKQDPTYDAVYLGHDLDPLAWHDDAVELLFEDL